MGLTELLFFSIMSRLLSKEDFGYFAAITAITAIFASLADTGIGAAIVQHKEINKKYLDNAFSLSLVIGLILTSSLCALSAPLSILVVDSSIRIPLIIVSCTLLLSCVTSVPRSVLHRNRMFFRMGLSSLISLIVSSVVAILLALKGYGFYAILGKLIVNSILLYFLSLIFAKTKFSFDWDAAILKKIFGFSGWLMASALFRNFAHSIDSLIMPRLMSVATLGAYNRPQGFISQISSQLNGIFDSALFPVLSEVQDDNKAIKSAYRSSVYYLNIFAMLLTICFIFNSELLIRIFFGEQWLDLKTIFIILSLTLIFNIDIRLTDCYLRSLALTRSQFIFRIIQSLLKIVCLVIGSFWGLIGFAVGGIVAIFLTTLMKMMYINKKVGIPFLETLLSMMSSWRAGLLFIPVMIFSAYMLPSSLVGNIINCIVMVVLFVTVFLFLPGLVGSSYKQNIYPKIKSKLKSLI
jgi:PST family polysaccharide transporter